MTGSVESDSSLMESKEAGLIISKFHDTFYNFSVEKTKEVLKNKYLLFFLHFYLLHAHEREKIIDVYRRYPNSVGEALIMIRQSVTSVLQSSIKRINMIN